MRISEYKRIVDNLTMADIEIGMRGHVSRHFGAADADLIERIKEEGVRAASTFDITSDEVLSLIKDVMLDETYQYPEMVIDWLGDEADGDNLILYKDYGRKIGHGFFDFKWHNWAKGAMDCTELDIVMKKVQRRYDDIFAIVTVFCDRSH